MIRNFLFHRVNPQRDILWDPMDVKLFEQCIKFISNKFEVVRIEDLAYSDKLFSNTEYATIMFDDGYKDNIEYAADVLAKYNCKASFYVVTHCIDKNIPTWTHLLEHAFQFTNNSTLNMDFSFLPNELKVKELPTKEERIDYVKKLKPFLKTITHENRSLVLDSVIDAYLTSEIPKLMMDWEDVKQLKNAGHYIGSHTITHAMLGTMNNEEEIKRELLNSALRIQEKVDHFPLTISYPVSSYNEVTKRLSKEAGYKIGLAVQQKMYDPLKYDFFDIPRIELYNEPWLKTRLRITNTLEQIKSIIRFR